MPNIQDRRRTEEQPNPARVYDYFLGGSANFQADRDFGDRVKQMAPNVPKVTWLNRAFLRRVVNYYLDRGITQFLDLGSGIPTVGNVHEIAQEAHPGARVVYVDKDAVAVEDATAMLAENPDAMMLDADIRYPDKIFNNPEVTALLDLTRPVGVLMVGLLLFIGGDDDPKKLVADYTRRVPSGSLIAISHLADELADYNLRGEVARLQAAYAETDQPVYVRTRAELDTWYSGLDPVAADEDGTHHGFVLLPDWRPVDDYGQDFPARFLGYGGVARVP